MSSIQSFKNLKSHLHSTQTSTVLHQITGFNLTIQPISIEGYDEINSIISPNPFSADFKIRTTTEKNIECNIVYFTYGIKEFEGNKQLARDFIEKEAFGESNEKVLRAIQELNDTPYEKVKDIILILAFSRKELKLMQQLIESGCKKELASYVSGFENPVEAFHFCEELFTAFDTLDALSKASHITIEHSALLHAKTIFEERQFEMPEELKHIELPNEKKATPQPNVNVKVEE